MWGNKLKKFDRFNVTRFMSAFIGSGKTFSILELARKNITDGQSVAIVTDWPEYGRSLKNDEVLGKVKWFKLNKIWDEICNIPFEYEDVRYDAWRNVRWKDCPSLKDFDYVLIDPACYEVIIHKLMDELNKYIQINPWSTEEEQYKDIKRKECVGIK